VNAATKTGIAVHVAEIGSAFLNANCSQHELHADLRRSETTGRPLGNAEFIADLERRLGRSVARLAPGPKPRVPVEDAQKLL
jgi:hypothetical protein